MPGSEYARVEGSTEEFRDIAEMLMMSHPQNERAKQFVRKLRAAAREREREACKRVRRQRFLERKQRGE